MKFLILLFISTSLFANTEWKIGSAKKDLIKIGDDGYVSKSCVKDCKLKKLVTKNKNKLIGETITGGKDPASVLCKSIGASVIYMAHKEEQETFCVSGEDIISLSLLLK